MTAFLYMIPAAAALGVIGLAAFLWAMRSGQFDDPDGDAARILMTQDTPIPDRPKAPPHNK